MSKDSQEMPQSRSTYLPRYQKTMTDEKQKRTKQCHILKHRRTNREDLQLRNCLGTVSRKTIGVGLKLVLLARNLTLKSDAVPNYKYMFSPIRSHPPHL